MKRKNSTSEKFWAKADRSGGPDSCWPWTAGKISKTNGGFWHRGAMQSAGRVAVELADGEPVETTEMVQRICQTDFCVNPRHLRILAVVSSPPRRPGGVVRETWQEKFIRLASRGAHEECWPWAGTPGPGGYGRFIGGEERQAHRQAYRLWVGPIPDGLDVLHTCDNPPCVNPGHLFCGTHGENMADMVAKGRSTAGEKSHSAKLTDELVVQLKADYAAAPKNRSGHLARGEGRKIADRYGICLAHAGRIASGRKWKARS